MMEEGIELMEEEQDDYKRLKDRLSKEILRSADVICSTCITSSDPRLEGMHFEQVLIDEATQAIEPECLLPMLHGAK